MRIFFGILTLSITFISSGGVLGQVVIRDSVKITATSVLSKALQDSASIIDSLRNIRQAEKNLYKMYSTIQSNANANGLVAFYPFNGNAQDESSNGHDGNVQGANLIEDRCGSPNTAYYFAGNDYINIGNGIKPPLPITVSAWIRIAAGSDGPWPVFSNNIDAQSYHGVWMSITRNLTVAINYGDGIGGIGPLGRRSLSSRVTLQRETWIHIVGMIYSESNMAIYINGVRDAGGQYSGSGGPLAYNFNNGFLGRHRSNNGYESFFKGAIDDISVYNRVLSAEEINELFTNKACLDHFEVTVFPDTVAHNDTAIVKIQAKDRNETDFSIPDTTLITFSLDANGRLYGNLLNPDGSQADSLTDVTYADASSGKIKYIANGAAPDSTTAILISVSQQNKPEITGSGQLVIESGLDHFEVTVVRDTIAYGDTVNIAVQPKNANDEDINLGDGVLLDFSLDANGEKYGSLLNPAGTLAKLLSEITFGDVKAGKAKYVANGENPIECDPKMFTVTVQKSDDATKNGIDTAWVKCKTYNFTRYAQGDPRWSGKRYDTYIETISGSDTTYYTIGRKGCALTDMSMVLQAHGVDNNPDTLNTWMINNSGFVGSAVKWNKLDLFPGNNKVKYKTGFGQGLQSGVTVPFSKIDPYLQKCFILVVQVKNPDTNRNHWVVLKEKKNGNYYIVDPGRDRTQLSEYSNNIYKVRVFVKK